MIPVPVPIPVPVIKLAAYDCRARRRYRAVVSAGVSIALRRELCLIERLRLIEVGVQAILVELVIDIFSDKLCIDH